MSHRNLHFNPALVGSGAVNCEYEDIFIWLSGLARGVADSQYMCQDCHYLGDACWHFCSLTGIPEASYYAYIATIHGRAEAEKPMAMIRRVRAWQIRQGM